MFYSRRVSTLIGSLLLVLVLTAACCGADCSRFLTFHGPVPSMMLAPGEHATYELFENVWTISSDCAYGGGSARSFPEDVTVASEHPEVATARLEFSSHNEPSLLRVTAHAPGSATIVLRTRVEEPCDVVLDATHFTVTVIEASPAS